MINADAYGFGPFQCGAMIAGLGQRGHVSDPYSSSSSSSSIASLELGVERMCQQNMLY